MRNLERQIGSICRKVAREFAEGTRRSKRVIRPEVVTELLGKPRFTAEVRRRTSEPGVATGLAWTPVGGDVLFVEAIAYPGDGKLQITGQLGDVMKESAAAALSYVKSKTETGELGSDVSAEWFNAPRPARARAGRSDPEGRAERGRDDGDGHRVAGHGPPRARRRGDDRRDHAHRHGAADRRAARRRRSPRSAPESGGS